MTVFVRVPALVLAGTVYVTVIVALLLAARVPRLQVNDGLPLQRALGRADRALAEAGRPGVGHADRLGVRRPGVGDGDQVRVRHAVAGGDVG